MNSASELLPLLPLHRQPSLLVALCPRALPSRQIEGAVKRAPLEERKKRKQDAAAAPAAEQQEGGADGGAAAPAPAEAPPAKKQRPAPKPRNAAAVEAAHLKHKWLRAVAVGGLTADTVEAAVGMARAAGQVRTPGRAELRCLYTGAACLPVGLRQPAAVRNLSCGHS